MKRNCFRCITSYSETSFAYFLMVSWTYDTSWIPMLIATNWKCEALDMHLVCTSRFSIEPIFLKFVYCMSCRILKCFQKMFQYANKKPTYRKMLIRNLLFFNFYRHLKQKLAKISVSSVLIKIILLKEY